MPKLSLEIEVKDKASSEFKKLESLLDKYGIKLKEVTNQQNQSQQSMAGLLKEATAMAAGYFAINKAIRATVGRGFAFNKLMEEQTNGIRALIVATTDYTDANGNALNIAERYALAQREATDVVKQLQEINKVTPQTIGQTAQIYKALFTSSKAAGASQEDMLEITKLISIAAGSAGIEFNQLVASVDGLANGTFLANSEMGRFLKSIGLAPDELKKLAAEGKSIDAIKERLQDFDFTTGSMAESTSNLANAWDTFVGNLSSDAYEFAKEGLNGIASAITAINSLMFGEQSGEWQAFQTEDIQDNKTLIEETTREIQRLREEMTNVTNTEFLSRTQKMSILTPLGQELKDNIALLDELQKKAKEATQTFKSPEVVDESRLYFKQRDPFSSDSVKRNQEARAAREELRKQVEELGKPIEYAFANGMQQALEAGDFSAFADNIKSAALSGLTEALTDQALQGLQSQFGQTGGIAALGGIGIGVSVLSSILSKDDNDAEEAMRAAAEALENTVKVLEASGQAGTAIVEQILPLQQEVEKFRNLADNLLTGFAYKSQLQQAETNLAVAVLGFSDEVTNTLNGFGDILDSINGNTARANRDLARSQARVDSILEKYSMSYEEFLASLVDIGDGLEDQIAIIESTAVGSDEYNAALNEISDSLGDNASEMLIDAINAEEALTIVGESMVSMADASMDAATTIRDIINSQQQFLDTNRSLVETSGESVARLQDRFVQEVNEANLAQIQLDEARASGSQQAIADAVANLNEQEQDVLELGQSVIDSAQVAYGSTDAATDIINAVLSEVEGRQTGLQTVEQALMVEANEISLNILSELQRLNATIETRDTIFGEAV